MMHMMAPQSQISWIEYALSSHNAMLQAFRANAKTSPYRTLRAFAEQEIFLPDGPFEGQRFRIARQPAHGLFFDEVDSGRWHRFACTGPQQSGKTLAFVVIPMLWHLFERQQTVLFGLPSMDMANDKWKLDIKPAIEASRFAKYLPRKGAGSAGGTPELIQFGNGSNLKFITAGGGDEKRAGITGPILICTEVSHLDEVGGKSAEATKLKQMEGRVRAYRASGQSRVYLESTVTTEEGRIWQEWHNGSAGLVLFPCHACGQYVHPDRDHLIGWQEAVDEDEAETASRWACPSCGILFDDATRNNQLKFAKLLHRGQSLAPNGTVEGQIEKTRTCGFRYTASTNTFMTTGIVGLDEWRAKFKEVDAENSEKELLQWSWCLPTKPTAVAVEPLDFKAVMFRQSEWYRGTMPADVEVISAGCDVRDRQLDWFVIGRRQNGQLLCIDYGFQLIQKELTGDWKTAFQQAFRELSDKFESGWQIENTDNRKGFAIGLIDTGWETDTIREAVAESQTWRRAQGFGYQQHQGSRYSAPDNNRVMHNIGEGWHDVILTRGIKRFRELQNDADHWKRRVHQALSVPADSASALLLPKTDRMDGRQEVAKQLTAEKEIVSFEVGKGNVRKWVKTFSRNHLFDAAYMAIVGLAVWDFELEKSKKQADKAASSGVVSGKKPKPFVRR